MNINFWPKKCSSKAATAATVPTPLRAGNHDWRQDCIIAAAARHGRITNHVHTALSIRALPFMKARSSAQHKSPSGVFLIVASSSKVR